MRANIVLLVEDVQQSKEYRADYSQWKEDRGYTTDWIKEEDK